MYRALLKRDIGYTKRDTLLVSRGYRVLLGFLSRVYRALLGLFSRIYRALLKRDIGYMQTFDTPRCEEYTGGRRAHPYRRPKIFQKNILGSWIQSGSYVSLSKESKRALYPLLLEHHGLLCRGYRALLDSSRKVEARVYLFQKSLKEPYTLYVSKRAL